mgnify:CR=1 FL=1
MAVVRSGSTARKRQSDQSIKRSFQSNRQPALDLRRFQARVDLHGNPDQMPVPFQIEDCLRKTAVTHVMNRSAGINRGLRIVGPRASETDVPACPAGIRPDIIP